MASKKIFFEKKIFLVSKKNFLPFQIKKKKQQNEEKEEKNMLFQQF